MEKIRSWQSFWYRKNGSDCTVIDVFLKKKARGSALTRALLGAIKRYPCLAGKLAEKGGDFYIADNRSLSLTARRTADFRPLESISNSYRPIEVPLYKEGVYLCLLPSRPM